MVSASLEQSRIVLGFVREALDDVFDDYRWLDSGQRLGVTHKATGTKLRVLSSSGKRAMGLSQFHTIYADEPGGYEVRGGALMFDALRQSLGKRSGQRLVMIGTPCTGRGWVLVAVFAGWRIRSWNACESAHGARLGALGSLEHDPPGEPSGDAQRFPAQDGSTRAG